MIVAVSFAFFNGMNDGGSILATNLQLSGMRIVTAVSLLAVSVGLVPLVVGTQVATTLTRRLAGFEGAGGRTAFMIAVVGATAVVVLLSRRGLPTSLTLALIGGILGVAAGAGIEVVWDWVVMVLVLSALAPAVGLVMALVIARAWGLVPTRTSVGRQVRRVQRVSFTLQAFAYAANDGQKMLAVFVAAHVGLEGADVVEPRWWMLTAIVLLFALGTLFGLRRYGRTLGSSVVPMAPVGAVNAQLSAAGAVLATGAVGIPVSMTQVIAGGLIGSSYADRRISRVRWNQAGRIALAWIMTLPAAVAVSALLGGLARLLTGGL